MSQRKRPTPDDEVEPGEKDGGSPKHQRLEPVAGEEDAPPQSHFGGVLRQAGLSMPAGGRYTTASTTQLSLGIKNELKLRTVFVEFLQGLEDHLAEEANLRASLLPIVSPVPSQALAVPQESLIKILLGIPDVQPRLVEMLFEKLPEFFDEDREDGKVSESIPRLILAQLRWMEYTCEESEITRRLLEIIDICPLHLKREIISALPDIVQDHDHEQVVAALEGVLSSERECTQAVLDSLSSLALEPAKLIKITDEVIQRLSSANPEDLPVVVRYLLQSTGPAYEQKVVRALRESLNFISCAEEAPQVQFSQAAGATSRRSEGEMLTLEAVRSGIKFRKGIVLALIADISETNNADAHRPFDVWALVLIRSLGDAKRQAEVDKVFRSKIKAQLFTQELLRESLFKHADALRPYFKDFRALGHHFLRSHDLSVARFGTSLYICIFKVFSDDCSRQDVLGDVMAHTGAGSPIEVEAALNVLNGLVVQDSALLRPFSSYIKGILEFLDNLTSKDHIRTVFRTVSMLGAKTGDEVLRLDDDVYNKIRKLLQSPELKYVRRGIIGAMSAAMVLSRVTKSEQLLESVESESCEGEIRRAAGDDQAESLLDTVLSNCERSCPAYIFMCEEMASALSSVRLNGDRISTRTLKWVDMRLSDMVTDNFVDDLEQDEVIPAAGRDGVHPTCKVIADMNLDHDEAPVAINFLGPIVIYENGGSEVLLKMCSHMRVMFIAELSCKGNLESLDALLGCPIWMLANHPVEEFLEFESLAVRTHYILSHFYAANWIIELLNAFVPSISMEEPEVCAKCVQRCNHLWGLLKILDECLEKQPTQLPDLNSASVLDEPQAANSRGRSSKTKALGVSKATNKDVGKKSGVGKKSKKGKKKKGSDTESDEEEEENTNGTAATAVESDAKQKEKEDKDKHKLKDKGIVQRASQAGILAEFENLREHSHCFRMLDAEVFQVLAYDQEIPRGDLVAGTGIEAGPLLALLQDMFRKVDLAFSWAHRKAFAFLSPSSQRDEAPQDPQTVFRVFAGVCPALVHHFKVAAAVRDSEETVDDRDNAAVLIKRRREESMHVIISIFLKVLTCGDSVYSGQGEAPHGTVLRCLAAAGGQAADSMDADPVKINAEFAIKFLESFASGLPSFQLSSAIISLMNAIADHVQAEEVNGICSSLALWCLKKGDFPDAPSKGPEKDVLNMLLKTHISHAACPITCVKQITTDLLNEMQPAKKREKKKKKDKKDKDEDEDEEDDLPDCVEDFPMVTACRFSPFYKLLLDFVADRMVDMEKNSAKTQDPDDRRRAPPDPSETMTNLSNIVDAFDKLITLTTSWNDVSVLCTAIKSGHRIISSFLRILPALNKLVVSKEIQLEELSSVVTVLSKPIKAMHNICAHGKENQEARMVNIIPRVKKTLELVMYKVKALLESQGYGQAFWLGTLKNRTVDGRKLPTQQETDDEEMENSEGDDAGQAGSGAGSETEGNDSENGGEREEEEEE